MKAFLFVLPLVFLAACDTSSTVHQTGETVVYAGKSYDVYVEQIHTKEHVFHGDYHYARRMIWVESRYIWCEPSCDAAIKALKGPKT
ncbi:hypothetical protein [Maritimibacter sp. DP1N21-5]|uniref:hypothetical protein n=1 Tax=Maritimibacter sp. DP1N21-5 TaxID=2836867 RepID=UPI001C48EB72|nr:hypothetical protein [Maritimibacter sp. DP1N21-5]MBV7408054.1 hypothetical protein [Maritimibacter sp. DP1N21-5]